MDGFLPLVEGFLAFALTMLALTTAVSVLVGVFHRLRRRRARGLREMVRLLYLGEIARTLPAEKLMAEPADEEDRDDRTKWRRAHRARFIAEMTLMPVPRLVGEITTAVGEGGGASTAGGGAPQSATGDPGQAGGDGGDAGKAGAGKAGARPDLLRGRWMERIESAEGFSVLSRREKLLHPIRYFRRWRTLRYTLDELGEEEFRVRLDGSEVGGAIRTRLLGVEEPKSEEQRRAWAVELDRLHGRFRVLGAAATETFARHSRSWSVLIGFLLAFGLNIDSFHLLESYLTRPEVRAAVLAQVDRILDPGDDPEPVETGSVDRLRGRVEAALAEARAGLADALGRLDLAGVDGGEIVDALPRPIGSGDPSAAASLEEALRAALGEALPPARAEAVMAELAAASGSLLARAEDLRLAWEEAEEVADELSLAERRVRGVVRSLGRSFPIGWELYPGCGTRVTREHCAGEEAEGAPDPVLRTIGGLADVADPRCLGRPAEIRRVCPPAAPAAGEPEAAAVGGVAGVWWTVRHASSSSRATFLRWLVGVVLTTLFLGLGTPFWTRAVHSLTFLRGTLEKPREESAGEGSAGGGGGS